MKRVVAAMLVAVGTGGMALAQGNAPAAVAPAAPVVAPVQKTWADSITLKGDLRYRYESINDDSKLDSNKENYTRQRDRIRARLSAEAKVNDNLKGVVGLSTGQSDPVSGNQTFTDGASKKDMKLDLAYMDYSFLGDSANELHVIGGKMKNPFMTMPNDLIFDGDLNPEGVAVKGQLSAAEFATFYGNGGYIWITERDSKNDAMLLAGQGAAKLQFLPEVSLTLGATYNAFADVQGFDVFDWESKNNAYGNSTTKGTVSGSTTNKAWATGFKPLLMFAQLDVWVGGLPLSIFGQQASNSEADKDETAIMYGVSLGKAKNPNTFEIGYGYAKIERDATLGMWTDSDRWGGGTDGQGNKVYGKYQIMKNLQAGVTYFFGNEKVIHDSTKTKDYDRMQVDISANF